MNTEAICYLLRKTSLTRTEIGKLKPDQLNAIVKEVYFQESIEEYIQEYRWACLLSAIKNLMPIGKDKRATLSKITKPSDFISFKEFPSRNPQQKQNELEQLASKHNVKLPTKEIKNRGE